MVVGPGMSRFIRGVPTSSMFLLACGSVVRVGEALEGLVSMTKEYGHFRLDFCYPDLSNRLKFSDAFAFGADRLIVHPVAIWMISYADKVIASGQPSKDAMRALLYASDLGKHTSVTHLTKSGADVEVMHYKWKHDQYRPNTSTFPLACPVCNVVGPWNLDSVKHRGGAEIVLKCKSRDHGGHRCTGTYTVPALPAGSLEVKAVYDGTWMVMP